MSIQAKQLYEEAGNLHKRAKDILAEFEGKTEAMPTERANEVDTLLDQVEAKTAEAKRLDRLEAQDVLLNQPAPNTPPIFAGASGEQDEKTEQQKLYTKAFEQYLRVGKNALRDEEVKALAVGDGATGGYLVTDTFYAQMLVKAREMSAMRRICNVLPPVPSGSLIVPSEDSIFSDASWTTEITTAVADTVSPFGQRRLQPHALSKAVKVSNTFMRVPSFDVEGYVRERMGYKFGVTEEDAFINGLGDGQPLGILKTASLPTYTTVTSNAVYGNDIIDWAYSLPAAYMAKARILCNRAFIRKLRTLSSPISGTAFDNYIWQPGLNSGTPNMILDWPYELTDRMDDGIDAQDVWDDSALVAVIGDWSFYWIVDAIDVSVQRLNELYATTNQVGFIGRKETDGMAVLAEAFYALKIKA